MEEGKTRRIAVIGIHGVGDHEPQEMAKAVGNLLVSRRDGAREPIYSTFAEHIVHVNIDQLRLGQPVAGATPPGVWGPFEKARRAGALLTPAGAARGDSIDHVFMKGQLDGYVAEGTTESFEFLRLEGKRTAAGSGEKVVHVYDMPWSDLSGVAKAGLRVFGELYQVLFHLGSVGVNNVSAAAAYFAWYQREFPEAKTERVTDSWNAFAGAQGFTADMLTKPVPMLNLILASLAVITFATTAFSKLGVEKQWGIAAAAMMLVISGIVWALLVKGKTGASTTAFRAPVIFGVLGTAAGSGAAMAMAGRLTPDWLPEATIAVALSMGIGYGANAMVTAYEKRRPGARKWFQALAGAVILLTAVSCAMHLPWVEGYRAEAVLVRAFEITFIALGCAWSAFWFGMVWAWFLGKKAVRAVRASEALRDTESSRASRTEWTARLTFALSATAFLLVTFAAWSGLLNAALPILPMATELNRCPPGVKAYVECDMSAPAFYYSPLAIRAERKHRARTWADGLFFDSGVAFVPLMLLMTGLAVLIAVYGVARAVADEVVPPGGSDEQRAVAGGEWLTNGFEFMRWSQHLLYWGVLLFLPLSFLGSFEVVRKYTHLKELSGPFVTALGSLVGGTAIGLFAFGGRLSQLALGLRTGVRVALDVDNWLREHPHGRNPTARICARYVSLLRCITEAEEPYDALVIFAHSQGTVITADLLRYIHAEYEALAEHDPGLARLRGMKICLFTMGCPLRQLYGQRFPYLYGYSERSRTQGPPPEPADLNVAEWTNGYRTGDYVGRYLWRDTDFWVPLVPFRYGSRTEVALGPGAHTHYWDHTADGVGEILDGIIAGA